MVLGLLNSTKKDLGRDVKKETRGIYRLATRMLIGVDCAGLFDDELAKMLVTERQRG